MARRRGWASRFAPIARAGDVIGRLKPELAALTGLSPKVRIHAGLHDSNAALHAARAFPEVEGQEATVLSTGTWFVAMRLPAEPVDLAALPEDRDCLVNVDLAGRPVPSSRWMGGREIECFGVRIDKPGIGALEEILSSGAMILPGLIPGSATFRDPDMGAANATPSGRTDTAIGLYAALMTDASLDLIGARRTVLIEGRFAASELFARALASLRPDCAVYTAPGDSDVSLGALRAIWPEVRPSGALVRAAPLEHSLTDYRRHWQAQIRTGSTS
jgi:sugar (pentulose or hexulose) kinase